MPRPPLISDTVSACRESFHECLTAPSLFDREWAENRLADLNLWAAGLGVFARKDASLDQRLALKPGIRDVVINLLYILKAFVDQCRQSGSEAIENLSIEDSDLRGRTPSITLSPGPPTQRSFSPWSDESSSDSTTERESSSPPSALAEAVKGTETILDQLARLAVAIRQSGAHARLQKADKTYNPDHHTTLRDHLTSIILSRSFRWGTTEFVAKFEELSEIQKRLVDANLKRRNRFIYAQKHARKLAVAPPVPVQAIEKPKPKDLGLPSKAQEPKETIPTRPPNADRTVQKPRFLTPNMAAMTNTTASVVEGSIAVPRATAPSQPARTAITSTGSNIAYPHPPRIKQGLNTFKCPCCCQILPAMFAQSSRWKKHLAGDISPYTCILPNCANPEVVYVTRESWTKHMSNEHRTSRSWKCLACSDAVYFDDEDQFVAHTKAEHRDTISDEQILFLTSVSSQTTSLEVKSCPLCSWGDEQVVNTGFLLDHVAEHVHSFSLRSLPWAPKEESEDKQNIEKSVRKVRAWFSKWPTSADGDEHRPVHTKQKHPEDVDDYFEGSDYFAESSGLSSRGKSTISSEERDLTGFPGEGSLDFEEEGYSPEKETNKPDHENTKYSFEVALQMDTHRSLSSGWNVSERQNAIYNETLWRLNETEGSWFLSHPMFKRWKEDRFFLWLYSDAGCGTLASVIIENLLQSRVADLTGSIAVTFFYCNPEKNDFLWVEDMVFSLITQLAMQCEVVPTALRLLFQSCRDKDRAPTDEETMDTFRQMVDERDATTFVILDGLEEYKERAALLKAMEKYWQNGLIHVLVTSTHSVQLNMDDHIWGELEIREDDQNENLRFYIRRVLESDVRLKGWTTSEIREQIENKLIYQSNGVYPWISRQLKLLGETHDIEVIYQTVTAPLTVSQIYGQILLEIPEPKIDLARSYFEWLLLSARPLAVNELLAGTDPGTLSQDGSARYYKQTREEVLAICPSLISIYSGLRLGRRDLESVEFVKTPVINSDSLSHGDIEQKVPHSESTSKRLGGPILQPTLKEFLTQESFLVPNFHLIEIAAHERIVRKCLEYLLQIGRSNGWDSHTLRLYPLTGYAAQYWAFHAQRMPIYSDVNELIMKLFSNQPAFLTWLRLFGPDNPSRYPDEEDSKIDAATPLYYASLIGLLEPVRLLLEQGADSNAIGGECNTALGAAAHNGHHEIVKLLLESGAEVDIRGNSGTALYMAACAGHDKVVSLLLMHGADLNACKGDQGTALRGAAKHGHETTVRLLLDAGAEVNNQDESTALHAAASSGHETICRLLLEAGAEVNCRTEKHGTALQAAAWEGHESIVRVLLDYGALSNAPPEESDTALPAAALTGCESIVRLLLENGAEVNALKGIALTAAASAGHESIVRLLLDRGADVDARIVGTMTALQAASVNGYESIVRLLLEKGADVNAFMGTALIAAASNDQLVLQLLRDLGADPDTVRYLIERGGLKTDIDADTALQMAAKEGHDGIVQQLLDHGADINAPGSHGTALYLASSRGYTSTVRLLLEQGADVNSSGNEHGTALYAAASNGHESILKILLEHGATVDNSGFKLETALHIAVSKGYEEIVQILRDRRSNTNTIS